MKTIILVAGSLIIIMFAAREIVRVQRLSDDYTSSIVRELDP